MCHILRLILRIFLAQSSGKHVSKETRRSWKTVLHVWTVWTVISCKFAANQWESILLTHTQGRSMYGHIFSWDFGNHLDHLCSNVLQVSLGITRYGTGFFWDTKSVVLFLGMLGRLIPSWDMSNLIQKLSLSRGVGMLQKGNKMKG